MQEVSKALATNLANVYKQFVDVFEKEKQNRPLNENETNFISIVKNSVYRAPKPREKVIQKKSFLEFQKNLRS